jgi:hypothetical protein
MKKITCLILLILCSCAGNSSLQPIPSPTPKILVCAIHDEVPLYQTTNASSKVITTLNKSQCIPMISSPSDTSTWIETELGWIQSTNAYMDNPQQNNPSALPTATATKPSATKPTAVKKTPTNAPVCNCSTHYKCANFSTHNQAHACFTSCGGSSTNNWNSLDSNHDGEPCQSLP